MICLITSELEYNETAANEMLIGLKMENQIRFLPHFEHGIEVTILVANEMNGSHLHWLLNHANNEHNVIVPL